MIDFEEELKKFEPSMEVEEAEEEEVREIPIFAAVFAPTIPSAVSPFLR